MRTATETTTKIITVTTKAHTNHKTYVQPLLGQYYIAHMKTRQIVSKGYKSFAEALTHRY